MIAPKIICTVLFLSLAMACGRADDSLLKSQSSCQLAPACKQGLPSLPAAKGFASFYKKAMTAIGKPHHRGRDVLAVSGAPINIHAKFSYGITDNDLKGEPIDLYLSSSCTSPLKKIGSVRTTEDDQHETVDNISDSGGRIYAKLSDFGIKNLPVGRHRLVFVVPADNSTTELYINIIAAKSAIVITDIDGTLTTSEMSAATEIIGIKPAAHPGAAQAMQALYASGRSIFYLTARPDWLMSKTRDWLKAKGFPPGTIHTTNVRFGAQGNAAANFKKLEIEELKLKTGITPDYAFGNKPSDVKAFGDGNIPAKHSYYFKLSGDALGGTIHSNYTNLLPGFKALPNVCSR